MNIRIGKKFWMAITAFIMFFTALIVVRNLLHAIGTRREINALQRERDLYLDRIARDSTLLEQLRYDDYLETYARERFHMQSPHEKVYLVEEK